MKSNKQAAGVILAQRLGLDPSKIKVFNEQHDLDLTFSLDVDVVLWRYEEFLKDADGNYYLNTWDEAATVPKIIEVPYSLIEEYNNHVQYGVPGE